MVLGVHTSAASHMMTEYQPVLEKLLQRFCEGHEEILLKHAKIVDGDTVDAGTDLMLDSRNEANPGEEAIDKNALNQLYLQNSEQQL